MSSAWASLSATKWTFPETEAWMAAEPMSSIVHFSYVTCSITLGPVMYMPALPELRMIMKSVRAGE